MKWTPLTKKALSVEDVDIQIMEAIPIAKSLQDIAKEVSIPRTSIAYSLKGLVKKGLVEKVKFGKRFRFIALTNSKLVAYFQKIIDEAHISNTEKKGVKIKPTKEDEFIIHVGTEEIIPAYSRIASENKNERIKAIQHHQAYVELLERITPEQLAEFNRSVKDNNLIIDGILNEGAYDAYKEEILNDPKKYEMTLGLEGRMADYSVFPNKIFNYDVEIWLFKTTTLFINWREEIAIEIINSSMTGFLKDMFEYVKKGSKHIDHNEAMRKLSEKVRTIPK